jgi:hypothetical protein
LFTGGVDRLSADWQAIVPGVTPRYAVPAAFAAPAPDAGLNCTLKLFPSRPEHCIEWAAHQLHRVLHRKGDFQAFEQCVTAAVDLFIAKFVLRIKDLQFIHPREEIVDGVYYWSRYRIFPTEVQFDVGNQYVRQFITAVAKLFARKSSVEIEEIDFDKIEPWINWSPPDAERRKGFVENLTPAQNSDNNHFDHDDEVQLDFIEAASNLRSANYGLGVIDRFIAQKIAGRIESAVSTTASVCAAAVLTAFFVGSILVKANPSP